jgi:hypothetical protein
MSHQPHANVGEPSRQQARLLEAYLAGILDLATFELKRNELQRGEEEVLAREREVVAQGQHLVAVENIARSATEILDQLSRGLEQASFEQRRELVELLIDRVVVTDDAVEIRYVIPTTDASTHTRFCQLRTDYLHFHADPLADGIPRVPRRPTVDSTPPTGSVLRDVRCDMSGAQSGDQVPRVVRLVQPDRLGMDKAFLQCVHHGGHHRAFRGAAGRGDQKVH